jgi:hypothetical protein
MQMKIFLRLALILTLGVAPATAALAQSELALGSA